MAEKKCACYDTDAKTCYELRIYGRSPVNRGPTAHYDPLDMIEGEPVPDYTDDAVCECYCHEELDNA